MIRSQKSGLTNKKIFKETGVANIKKREEKQNIKNIY